LCDYIELPLAKGSTVALSPTHEEIEKLLKSAPKYAIEILLSDA
jgi:hypothetical protein